MSGVFWLSSQLRKLEAACPKHSMGPEVHFLLHSTEPCAFPVILLNLKLHYFKEKEKQLTLIKPLIYYDIYSIGVNDIKIISS